MAEIGSWLSAALEDAAVCAEMKSDIRAWFDAGERLDSTALDVLCELVALKRMRFPEVRDAPKAYENRSKAAWIAAFHLVDSNSMKGKA